MKSSSSPLFSQTLYYNDSYGSNTPRYNGNISAMSWTTSGDKTRGYNFAYDNLSRLTAAGYMEGGVANTSYGTSYAYDKHGNMTNLVRNGRTGTSIFGTIDNLSMSYAGNQLIKADDAGTSVTLSASMDFKNNSTAAKEYSYDLNGNLTKDLNKGITGITYNLLNLPQSVAISNTLGQATNTYTYAADGRKLRTVQQWSGTNSEQTDYVDNVIYESVNGTATTLKRILVDGGYIEGGAYYFYLTDHLGNNRVVANASGGIVQTSHYYPFGMSFAEGVTASGQPYKYNGKELDTERGLNLYDYSARLMDPVLGRFSTVDPLCEKYPEISPYVYCHNNPVNIIDPEGLTDYSVNKEGYIYKTNPILDAVRKFFGIKDKDDKLIAVNNKNNTLVMPAGSVGEIKSYTDDKGNKVGDYFNVSNDKVAGKVDEFLSENTGVEFSRIEYNNSKESDNIISTSHKKRTEAAGSLISNKLSSDGYNVSRLTHSHPEGGLPSGYVPEHQNSGDKDFTNYMNRKYPNNTTVYRVYDVPRRRYIYYNNANIYKYENKKRK